jgi:hypothetical protein
MNSFPHEQSPSPRRPVPLGRLLVERGLLTEQQLIEGLLEQDRTGDRLGKVLIDLGFVDAPSIAMALATQYGGPLKTEYGFATGFDSGRPTEPVTKQPTQTQAIAAPENGAESPPIEAAAIAAAADELAATAPLRRACETAFADPQTFPAEHDRAPSQIGTMITEPDAAQAELDAAHTRIADLDRGLVAAREELDQRQSRTADLEDKLAAAKLAAETAIAALRRVTEASP